MTGRSGGGVNTGGWVLVLGAMALLGSAGWAAAAQAPEGNSCIECHKGLGDPRLTPPAERIGMDVHLTKGIACQNCHGGDPASFDPGEAMSRTKGFIGKPKRTAIPALCGKCHSDPTYMRRFNPTIRVDQVTEYFTSVHGRKLREGDGKVATCINCHDVHNIRAIKDQQAWTYPLKVIETCGRCHADPDYMKPYKIPTDQLAKYKKSVHYGALAKKGDLSAPTCNVCHGNHGATPPGVASVAHICGQCHSTFEELFDKSPHKRAFAAMGLAPCIACHGNHEVDKPTEAMLGTDEKAVCVSCHAPDSGGYRAAAAMRAALDDLRSAIGRSRELLDRAEHAGMEVSIPKFELKTGTEALIKARAAVHTFRPPEVKKLTDEGLTVALRTHAKGLKALDELQFRRKGLGVSVVIILMVIAGLILKIREIDRRGRAGR